MTRIHIGAAIKRLRKAKGIQQKCLAVDLGISVSGASMIETRSNMPQLQTLENVARVLGVSVEAILIWSVQEQNVSEACRVLLKELKAEIIK